jgi:NADPH-dependent curcumin reductase CurA
VCAYVSRKTFSYVYSIENHGVGVVLRSENSAVTVGQHLYGMFSECPPLDWPSFLFLRAISSEFVEYFVGSDPTRFRVLPQANIPLSVYLGVAGMPGQTAVYS